MDAPEVGVSAAGDPAGRVCSVPPSRRVNAAGCPARRRGQGRTARGGRGSACEQRWSPSGTGRRVSRATPAAVPLAVSAARARRGRVARRLIDLATGRPPGVALVRWCAPLDPLSLTARRTRSHQAYTSACTYRPRLHPCRLSLTLQPPPGPRLPVPAVCCLFVPRGGHVQSRVGTSAVDAPTPDRSHELCASSKRHRPVALRLPLAHATGTWVTAVSAVPPDGGPWPRRWRRSRACRTGGRAASRVACTDPRRSAQMPPSHAAWRTGGTSARASR